MDITRAIKIILSFVKVWFKILESTDTGAEFIAGIESQVSLIHNLDFKEYKIVLKSKRKDIDIGDIKDFAKLSRISKRYNITPDRLGAILSNMDSMVVTVDGIPLNLKKNMRLKDNEKRALKAIDRAFGYKVVRTKEPNNSIQETFLQRILNQPDDFLQDTRTREAFNKAGLLIIKNVFMNTKIRYNNYQAERDIDDDRRPSIVKAIKRLSKIKNSTNINVSFEYNNFTQYGDLDTYNQWIDNITIVSTTSDWEQIDFNSLLKNATLIDSKFNEHNYKAPNYPESYE